MSYQLHLRNLGKALKLFVVGSFVASRTASGAPDPADTLRHEMAWTTVRDRLAAGSTANRLSSEIRRIVEQEIEMDLNLRVSYTYKAIPINEIAKLDGLWMDQLVGRGASAEDIDRFLVARNVALSQLIQTGAEEISGTEEWRNVIREFGRSSYTGG